LIDKLKDKYNIPITIELESRDKNNESLDTKLQDRLYICLMNRSFLRSNLCMHKLRQAIDTFKKVVIVIDLNESENFHEEYESLNLNKANIIEFLCETGVNSLSVEKTLISYIDKFQKEVF
jgi:hypothetical protein